MNLHKSKDTVCYSRSNVKFTSENLHQDKSWGLQQLVAE